MKAKLTLSIIAILALSACGGSSKNHDTIKPDTQTPDKPDTQTPDKPQTNPLKYTGKIHSGDDDHNTLNSDQLYTIKTTDGNVSINLDSDMSFPSGADDIEKRGTRDSKGANGGAYFSKKLSHATFGAIADYNMQNHTLYNYRSFYQGEATTDMPNSGKATYEGRAIQFPDGGDMKPDVAKGTMRAQADFGNKTVKISLNYLQHPAGIDAAKITGNTFKGQEKGVAWQGGFFGDSAGELAGTAKSDSWTAAYGGMKK